jgi:hypothetical protein
MLQERLNGLTMCSIENDILDIIDLESVLEDFASRNARIRFFKKHWSTLILSEVTIIVILPFFIFFVVLLLFREELNIYYKISLINNIIYFNRHIKILCLTSLRVHEIYGTALAGK